MDPFTLRLGDPLLPGPRLYPVREHRRTALIEFMLKALRDGGCRIISWSRPSVAPFVIVFETASGERMGVVAYAFTATRTVTRNRPEDERSFQIKYGSKTYDAIGDPELHEIWQDPLGLFTTLLVGIDPEGGYFVSADPEMHNPTKFYIRLEFKDEHAEALEERGWHAWERAHRGPMAEPTEVLVGGVKERFLDLVRFERAAHGLSQGDRQLLAEKPDLFSEVSSTTAIATAEAAAVHPLVAELALPPERILELIAGARRLKMAVRGWVAEEKLRESLAAVPGVTSCARLDEDGSPDIEVRWQGRASLLIECKNVLRKRTAAGIARIDFQRTRAAKGNPCSRYYAPGDFDIVAGCLHAVTEEWRFKYVRSSDLAPHAICVGKLASNVQVTELWNDDPAPVFEAACRARE